ncbi:unnamed protein product, partial [Polarella glacialis]
MPACCKRSSFRKQGLTATLKMDIPICLADQQSSVSPQVASVMELMKTHRFGHLPLYKGYEHLGYGAKVVLPQLGQTPSDYDHRKVYPMCYPSGGQEVVRNQGNCGSCWAFASASALMANLCASGQGANALFSATDRYEVSVQGIMSCNAKGSGCAGGNYFDTGSSLASAGIAKEKDFKYKCGSGDSSKHFEEGSKSCEAAPWGATCSPTANPTWHYDGFTSVEGEDGIMGALVLGAAQYVSLNVNSGFMSYSSGVYSDSKGTMLGGHAVTALGFGVESGQKYWLIQNSWGTNWGQGGFAKVVRGVGFMGIEDRGTIIKGHVDGGSKFPCFDASHIGTLSCADMKSWCNHSTYGSMITDDCPVTCQKAGCVFTTAPAATTAAPTTTTMTVPTAAPTAATTTSYCTAVSGLSCSGYSTRCCPTSTGCAISDGLCGLPVGPTAAPTTATTTSYCTVVSGLSCSGYSTRCCPTSTGCAISDGLCGLPVGPTAAPTTATTTSYCTVVSGLSCSGYSTRCCPTSTGCAISDGLCGLPVGPTAAPTT